MTVTPDGSNSKVTLGLGNSCTATCNAKNITIANIKAYHNDGLWCSKRTSKSAHTRRTS